MGRDLSANHLCPYLQGGENIKHAQQDRQGQVLFQLPPGSAPFCPGCLSSLLHLARHFLPNLPSPLCLPCWPAFFSSRLSSVNCQSYLLLHNFFQVTIQESREGLAVWLLWGFFELIMKVTHCKTDFQLHDRPKVINLLNKVKYLLYHLMWIHQVRCTSWVD